MTKESIQKESSSEKSKETQQERLDLEDDPCPADETGGPGGLEPTRYGDWERKGRCIDF